MKRLKKILLLAVAMILVAAISVTATMAYLKSQTYVRQNAFAIGNVKVSLDEAKVNENGQLVDENGNVVDDVKDAARVIFNSCELAPGGVYNIAPTVHVEEGSEDCIVFVLLCMPRSLTSVYDRCIEPQIRANGWSLANFPIPDGAVGSAEFGKLFAYNKGRPVSENTAIPFFNSITIDESVTYDKLKEADLDELRITAFAFQNEGTDDMFVKDVWNIILETYYPVGLKKQ